MAFQKLTTVLVELAHSRDLIRMHETQLRQMLSHRGGSGEVSLDELVIQSVSMLHEADRRERMNVERIGNLESQLKRRTTEVYHLRKLIAEQQAVSIGHLSSVLRDECLGEVVGKSKLSAVEVLIATVETSKKRESQLQLEVTRLSSIASSFQSNRTPRPSGNVFEELANLRAQVRRLDFVILDSLKKPEIPCTPVEQLPVYSTPVVQYAESSLDLDFQALSRSFSDELELESGVPNYSVR